MTKRVIVTGAAGFIGANLARRLLSDGHQVHILLQPNCSNWRVTDILSDVHPHTIDLGNREGLNKLMPQIRPHWIFHLAVYGAYSYQTNLRQMLETNIVGTTNLLEACLQTDFETFINTGSSSEYGFKDHPPKESEVLEPNSYYAVTKASATYFCQYIARSKNINIPTLRLYNIYGPYEEPTRLMPTLIVKGLEGKLPPLVNPDIARDLVYMDDISEAYMLTARTQHKDPGAIYNVGSGVQTTLRTMVEIARTVLGITAEPQWGSMQDRIWDTKVWVADSEKIRTELGWKPRYSFEQGFRLMLEWFKQNPSLLEYYRKQMKTN